jgi:hypothetical protein
MIGPTGQRGNDFEVDKWTMVGQSDFQNWKISDGSSAHGSDGVWQNNQFPGPK